MQLVINGIARSVPDGLTVAALVENLGMKSDRVAVELNREIVPRGKWMETRLTENDRLEIVHFVGGGMYQKDAFVGCRGSQRPGDFLI